jgi:hypothetical protein
MALLYIAITLLVLWRVIQREIIEIIEIIPEFIIEFWIWIISSICSNLEPLFTMVQWRISTPFYLFKDTLTGHRKHRSRFRFDVIPITFGIFTGVYCLSMYWAHLLQQPRSVLTLNTLFYVVYIVLRQIIGALRLREPPPWLLLWSCLLGHSWTRWSEPHNLTNWGFVFEQVVYLRMLTILKVLDPYKELRRYMTMDILLVGFRLYNGGHSVIRYLSIDHMIQDIWIFGLDCLLLSLWMKQRLCDWRKGGLIDDPMTTTSPEIPETLTEDIDLANATQAAVDTSNIFCVPVGTSLPPHIAQMVALNAGLTSHTLATRTLKHVGLDSEGKQVVLVVDTGASMASSGCKEDFVAWKPSNGSADEMKGIATGLAIAGYGTIEWTISMDDGTDVTLQLDGAYVPALKSDRLLSPQGIRTADGHPASFTAFTFDEPRDRSDDPDAILVIYPKGRGWRSALPLHTRKVHINQRNNLPEMMANNPSSNISAVQALQGAIDVTVTSNKNISNHSKVLLQQHYRLGHIGFQHLRWLIRSGAVPVRDKDKVANSDIVKCAACEYGKAAKRPTHTTVTKGRDDKEMELKKEDLFPGSRVSVDHYESRQPGRLYQSRGSSATKELFCGGMIFVDHASGFIDVRHQVSLSAMDTIKAKIGFEREAFHDGVKIQAYHSDNGVFTSKSFLEELVRTNQTIRFSGAGAGHQGGVAERSIRTIVTMARTMMLHAALRHGGAIKPEYWPQCMDYAVWLYNNTPRMATGVSPREMWSRTRHSSASDLLGNCHVWGAPVFVLEPKLRKDGVKIPKWAPRSRQGVFMGFSKFHSSLIGLVLNKSTGTITAQYHCIYDDAFTTVPSASGDIDKAAWTTLISCPSARLRIILDEDTDVTLHDEWLAPEERTLLEHQRRAAAIRRSWSQPTELDTNPLIQRETTSLPDPLEEEHDRRVRFEQDVPSASSPDSPTSPSTTTPLNVIPPIATVPAASLQREQPPSVQREQASAQRESPAQRELPAQRESTPLTAPGQRRSSLRIRTEPNRYSDIQDQGVSAGKWRTDYVCKLAAILEKGVWTAPDWSNITEYLTDLDDDVMSVDPTYDSDQSMDDIMAYKAAKKNDPDTPNFHDATTGENSGEYWDAMNKEISDLTKRRSWDVVPRSEAGTHQVVPGTWAFKAKRYPDGRFRKFKARFCVRGDVQKLEGGGSVDSYSPVVSWVTVRLMLILSLILSLKTTQIDFSNAFAQADLKEPVYLALPRGFNPTHYKVVTQSDMILRLNKSLYGMTTSPKMFYEKLRAGMEARGFQCLENLDPCLFIKNDCIAFCYVDDMCFFYRDQNVFDDIIQSFKADGDQYNWELTVEGDVNTFLGINMQRNEDNSYKFLQTGLIDKVLHTTGMTNCNSKSTPCNGDGKPLGADRNGPPANQDWSYASVVGMLLYLSSNSRCDIAFAVHQCARFTHTPRASHEKAVIRICRYLKGTRDEGIVFRPNKQNVKVDCYVDADFAGLYGTEDSMDPSSVKSRTGYVILLADCPLMWVSRLQTTIALSTQHSEYVALSTACRDLIPIRELMVRLSKDVSQLLGDMPYCMKSTCFEDNAACLALAKLRKITPQNRHIGSKYHWFRSYVLGSRNNDAFLDIVKVATDKQMADMFTKNLTEQKFLAARKQLCGW